MVCLWCVPSNCPVRHLLWSLAGMDSPPFLWLLGLVFCLAHNISDGFHEFIYFSFFLFFQIHFIHKWNGRRLRQRQRRRRRWRWRQRWRRNLKQNFKVHQSRFHECKQPMWLLYQAASRLSDGLSSPDQEGLWLLHCRTIFSHFPCSNANAHPDSVTLQLTEKPLILQF